MKINRYDNFKSGAAYRLLLMGTMFLFGCSDFVEVDPPKNTLVAQTVFDAPDTVESALAQLYHSLREAGMVSGTFGLGPVMGIYADELDYYGFDGSYTQLYRHTVTPDNALLSGWWSEAYAVVYGANAIIEGVGGTDALLEEDRDRFLGQALFVRAYMHSLLTGVFGDVPYVTVTDYQVNNVVSRSSSGEVYGSIIADLERAVELLEASEVVSVERVVPDRYAAMALLARMYLYTGQWEAAEGMASSVLDGFALEPDLDRVFLKGSPETLWQLKPGEQPRNTQEANQFIIRFIPGQTYALAQGLMDAFEPGDLRRERWTARMSDTENTITLDYAYKYKALFTETESLEYSIVLRVAEQYLIRAEARAQLGDVAGAREDLNAVRHRAGLGDTPASTVAALLEAIHRERFVELFTEQGHRWFDLKRTGRADAVLSVAKTNWQPTGVLLPVPESELEINPNLLPQNPGY